MLTKKRSLPLFIVGCSLQFFYTIKSLHSLLMIDKNNTNFISKILETNFDASSYWKYFTGRNIRDKPSDYFITVSPGRLGNQIFTFASSLGLAYKLKQDTFLPADSVIRDIFMVSVSDSPTVEFSNQMEKKVQELAHAEPFDGCHFSLCDGFLMKQTNKYFDVFCSALSTQHDENLLPSLSVLQKSAIFHSYAQSWKYFDGIKHIVLSQLRFKDHIETEAKMFIADAIQQQYPTADEVVLIGIHVRRGDMIEHFNGFRVAPESYILEAMTYFESFLGKDNILYVVCSQQDSETKEWVQNNIKNDLHKIVFSEGHDRGVDLAILSHCHHIIQTIGSFGWWGAYLSGGMSTYYSGFAKENSAFEIQKIDEDYYLPHWVGLPVVKKRERLKVYIDGGFMYYKKQ